MDAWKYLEDYESNSYIDVEACRKLLFETNEVSQIKDYLDQILRTLKSGNVEIIKEAKSIALPLSYRLSIDDTSNNYRISSKINSEIFKLENPELSKCISDEIKHLIFKTLKIRYDGLRILEKQIDLDLKRFAKELDDDWYIYGRVKELFSIYLKLYKFKKNKKKPKKKTDKIKHGISNTLRKFEKNVHYRLNSIEKKLHDYETEYFIWIIPDLIAVTFQQSIKSNHTRNLGSLKSKYKSINNRLIEECPFEIFYGPSYSTKWHINRLVTYGLWNFKNYQIPMELFIRTDFDYFIGYANYWRYKGINLFAGSHTDKTDKNKKDLIKRIYMCVSFSEVQEMLYKEIKTGQLELF